MTVADLVRTLAAHPDDLPVMFTDEHGTTPITGVYVAFADGGHVVHLLTGLPVARPKMYGPKAVG